MGEFYDKLDVMADQGRFLCVGLDPDPEIFPDIVMQYHPDDCRRAAFQMEKVVEATKDIAAAFKPNIAFYEQFGEEGIYYLGQLMNKIIDVAPEATLALDAKRGDIGKTNAAYAKAHFEKQRADALTINPYLGKTANLPFLERTNKGLIVLARTSNDDASEFQDLPQYAPGLKTVLDKKGNRIYSDEQIEHLIETFNGNVQFPLFAVVASSVRWRWNTNNNCAVVAGATYPEELAIVRSVVGEEVPILIPGVGTQGGDARDSAFLGSNKAGRKILINISSAIAGASMGDNFAEAAGEMASVFDRAIKRGVTEKLKAA